LKDSLCKKVVKEVQSIKNKIFGKHEELHKYMNIVNSIGFLEFDDGNMDSEALPKSFNDAIANIKDNEMPTSSDFTTLANIESMLYLNRNLMLRQSMKIKEFKWQKDVCRVNILSLKNPHSHAT
jgi:hypothetical protein